MIRRMLSPRAQAGQGRALEQSYAQHAILEHGRKLLSCRSPASLRADDSCPEDYLVTADWETSSDNHRWLADSCHASRPQSTR